MYSGKAEIFNYTTNTTVKSIDVTDVPVRAGKFIARKNWIVLGSDDYQIRVYNYNTGEKITQFEGHPDYIRCIAVHPSRPYILTSSDDYTIKLWNWENNWKNEQIFEGHQHYVMSVAFNPKDQNTFASACLDKSVKIWSIGSNLPNYTMFSEESKGFNYVDYYPHGDKPYLLTSSDDKSVKIWDYQTKSCVATLDGHISNVSFAIFHPELPLIISGSEDSTIKIWNANTYKLEKTLNYRMERAWCVSAKRGSSMVAVGFDTGNIVFQLGDDKPLLSMDPMGKIIWCKHNEVYHSVIKSSDAADADDGEILSISQKELGSVEVFPTSLVHSPNGRFVAVTGDDEYIIYTSLAWRNKMYGSALDFAWAQDSNYYAIRESKSSVKIFKNFKEKNNGQINLIYSADKIFGGTLLTVKSEGFVSFYDWESGELVRRVNVDAENVIWSENGELVLIISNDFAYALSFQKNIFIDAIQNDSIDPEEGVEGAIDVIYEVDDQILTGKWVGDVFIYTSSSNRLNYLVGGSSYNLAHFDKTMFLLGYLPRDNKVYVCDKDMNVLAYYLSIAVLEYQTVIMRGELEMADELLDSIPSKDYNTIARFLEEQGFKEKALELAQDNDQKFDLALDTLNLSLAASIAKESQNLHKWKKLGDIALQSLKFDLAIESFTEAQDYQTLLLIFTSLNDKKGLIELSNLCSKNSMFNVAFAASWAANDLDGCLKLLMETNRWSEAALLAKSYGINITQTTQGWKKWLEDNNMAKVADRIIVPQELEPVSTIEEKEDSTPTATTENSLDEPVQDQSEANKEESQNDDVDESEEDEIFEEASPEFEEPVKEEEPVKKDD